MKASKIVIRGLDNDPDTVLEFYADKVEYKQDQEPKEFRIAGKVHNSYYQRRKPITVYADGATTASIKGGFRPDSLICMVARAGRANLRASKVNLEGPKAYAVRLRMIDPAGKSKMKTYIAASARHFIAQDGFPTHMSVITNPAEVEEIKSFTQFEVVEITTNPGTVDGELAKMHERFQRIVDNAEEFRHDPDRSVEIFDELEQHAALFARTLRSTADEVEQKLEEARVALYDSVLNKGGKP